jgi:phosphate transport system substrate-binding protein
VKLKKCVKLLAIVLLITSGCVSSSNETINVSGAWALYPLMITWSEEYTAIHPDIRIDVSAGGAGKGMADVLGGLVDIGMVSREIYPQEIEKGAFWITVAKDAVIPIVNKDNPYITEIYSKGITKEIFYKIYIAGDITTWGDIIGNNAAEELHVYTRSDACGAAQTWASYLGYAQEDLKGVGVYGDPGVVEAVATDIYGIGYANLNFAYDINTGCPAPGVKAIPIDLNGNGILDHEEDFYSEKSTVIHAIASGIYPSPPARNLYVVTKGKPTGVVKEFLLWILTDGQQYVEETGYIVLDVADEIKKLEE